MSKKTTKTTKTSTKTSTPKTTKHTVATLKRVDSLAGKAQSRVIKMLDALDALTDQVEDGTLSPNALVARLRKITRGHGEDSAQDLDEIICVVQDAMFSGRTVWDMPINGTV